MTQDDITAELSALGATGIAFASAGGAHGIKFNVGHKKLYHAARSGSWRGAARHLRDASVSLAEKHLGRMA